MSKAGPGGGKPAAGGGAPDIGESQKIVNGELQIMGPDGNWIKVTSSQLHHGMFVRVDHQSLASGGISYFSDAMNGPIVGPSFKSASSPLTASPTRSFAAATGYTGQMGGGSLAFTPARQSSGAGIGAGAGDTGM